MTLCSPDTPARTTSRPRAQRPHAPPGGPRRFALAGADVSASLAVFLIALPLSLGIALAAGAPLQTGLVAAAVGGIVAGRLGGSPLQVSGPAAGLTVVTRGGSHLARIKGQLTFLAAPRPSRAPHQIPAGADAVVELEGSFMDHAAHETPHDWQATHRVFGGTVATNGPVGEPTAERPPSKGLFEAGSMPGPTTGPAAASTPAPTAGPAMDAGGRSVGHPRRPWTPWPGHRHGEGHRTGGPGAPPEPKATGHRLASGVGAFQRDTAPLVRAELARLARDGQRPTHLFLTCSDSRLVTSMITASGPGDLFTVRNVGNLVPPPGEEGGDDSVAAAIEYAVEVLRVESITVCGHSGCGAMQALLQGAADGAPTPLRRWLRHARPSLARMRNRRHSWVRISGRLPADEIEQLCLTNVVQQLEHLRAYPSVARRLAEGGLSLHGMYFHVGEAQVYLLAPDAAEVYGYDDVFTHVPPAPDAPDASDPNAITTPTDPIGPPGWTEKDLKTAPVS
ncbi:carbonic anhydrase [Streptomyces sp. NPDC048718]|uniref:carbonic anhydrase n=1 Tax=Streptomyces sp. NPDC048718 TaxID=3365587 RepID=UPI0037240C78